MGRITVLLLVVAIGAAACTSDDSSTTTTDVPTSTAPSSTTTSSPPDGLGGDVTIGVSRQIATLNPFSELADSDTRLVGQAVWATIYEVDPDTWERTPETVTGLPSQTPGAIEVGADGSMTVRYEVRRGATWSDGTPITGADIEFTAVAMFQLAAAGSPTVHSVMGTVTDTASVEQVAWITFSEATLAFEDALSVILPSHAIQDASDVRLSSGANWPSGGPFVVADSQPSGALVLERNPHYWKTDDQGRELPYLDSISFVRAEQPGLESDLFASRDADVIVVPLWPDAITAIPVEAELQQVASPIIEHLTFQFGSGRDAVNPDSWNDTLDYRKAIAFSLDREAVVAEAEIPWMTATPGILLPSAPSAWSTYRYDPSTGRDLVQSLGGEAEPNLPPAAVLSTTGNGDYRPLVGDVLVGSLAGIGVTLETDYSDSVLFFGEALGRSEFDIGMWAWFSDGGYASQLELLRVLDPAETKSNANYGNWGDGESPDGASAAFSELAAEARSTVDPVRFSQIIAQAEQILADQIPLIPLVQRSSHAAVWTDSVSGVSHNGATGDVTWNVEFWQKPGE